MYRILIADDEAAIREGVAAWLRRSCPDYEVVGTAEDGEEALQLAQRLLPDVILTDIAMPRMDGLDFLEQIVHLLPDTRLIVLSGYDNFDYARQAMRLGVRAYLSKPLNTEELRRMLAGFAREFAARPALAGGQGAQAGCFLGGQAGGLACSGEAEDSGAKGQAACSKHISGQMVNGTGADTQAARLKGMLEQGSTNGAGSAAFPKDADLLCCCLVGRGRADMTALCALLTQKFEQAASCFETAEEACVLVISFPRAHASASFLKINLGLTSAANQLRSAGLGELHFFMGEIVRQERLQSAYRQAREAADSCFLDQADAVVSYKDVVAARTEPCVCPPKELVQALELSVRYGEAGAQGEAVNALGRWYKAQGGCDAVWLRESLEALAFRVLGALPECTLTHLDLRRLHGELCAAQTFAEALEKLAAFVDLAAQKGAEGAAERTLAERVDFMIQQNLADPDFSLDAVAGQLFISPNYLRGLFKKETGLTFGEYLTRARLKRAARLLQVQKLSVAEAAGQVGYRDPRYFSACFKKQFGLSPSEYAEGG